MNRRKPPQVFQPPLGLYSRAILLVGVVLVGISIVVTFWNIQTEHERLTEELESRVADLATQQAVSVSNSLWDLNRDSVRVILQGLEQDPDFASVSVFDEKGRIFVEIGSTDLTGSPNVAASRDIVLEEQGVQKTIGSLTLTLSRGRLQRAQRQALDDALFLAFAQLVALIIAVTLVLRAVLRPLAAVTERMVAVARGDLTSPIPHDGREDAIGDVARAVVSFRDSATALTRSQEAISRAHDELEELVEQRTRELRESERRFRDYAEASADWFWEMDADLRFTYMSANVEKILGIPPEWHYGKTREELLGEDYNRDAWDEHIKTLREHKPFRDFEYLRTGEGVKPLWLRASGIPVFTEEGTFAGYRGTGLDISKEKQAQERLRESEEQLLQAQKMEAVGQLTGGVAHDFNNLLAVIMGNSEMLLNEIGQENSRVQGILRASTRGAELVQRLLAFSRRQPLRPRPVDLIELVDSMSELIKRSLGETIEVETIAESELWFASVDPGQVEAALLNLALNARDAMSGGGKLTIECGNVLLDEAYVAQEPELETGDYVFLAVTDSGTGMSSEVKQHAFEPFFTTKEVGEGSGLGLSMVYGFAKQSGGHVMIYSEEGKGTTVKLYLPRDKTMTRREEPKDTAQVPHGLGEVVLVVEDDAEVCKVAVEMLGGLGYKVIYAREAASARALLEQEDRVDLLLADVILPGGISGPEFAEQAMQRYPDLEVIFMSGYPAEAAKRNGFLGSNKVLLNKPFQKRQLALALRNALDA